VKVSSKIPIILITGYLGSGKTTFVNHLLALPEIARRKVALVINEFGSLGVDGSLVDSDRAGKKYEINSGSLFCTCTRLQLVATLQDIAEARPDVVLIEATGIAEPADVLSLISDVPSLAEQFTVQATVGLIDAKNFTTVVAFMQAARRQAESVDGLVINKTDLASPTQLQQLRVLLGEMNPRAPQISVTQGGVSMDWLNSLQPISAMDTRRCDRPPVNIFSASIQTDRPVNRQAFMKTLADYSENMLRLKGNIDFGDGPVFVELAGGDFLTKPAVNIKDADSGTALAVIAWNMDKEKLTAAFEKTFSSQSA